MQYATILGFDNGFWTVRLRDGTTFTAREIKARRKYFVIDGKLYLREPGSPNVPKLSVVKE